MALNGKTIGIKRIIESVIRDNGYTDYEINWNDVIEWAGDAIDLIGVPASYTEKTSCPINIVNYRGFLPCDLHKIIQTREYDKKIPMRYATNTFHTGLHCQGSPDISDSCNSDCSPVHPADSTISTSDDDNTNCNPFFNFNPNPTSGTAFDANSATGITSTSDYAYTYIIQNDCIFTSFKEGKVEMVYLAFPTDEDGFPLIPDNQKYIEAVKSFIRMKIDYKLWRTNKIAKDIYEDSAQEWYWYVGAARNAANIPSIDKMESIKNSWLRSIPKINQHDDSFSQLDDPEQKYTHNSI